MDFAAKAYQMGLRMKTRGRLVSMDPETAGRLEKWLPTIEVVNNHLNWVKALRMGWNGSSALAIIILPDTQVPEGEIWFVDQMTGNILSKLVGIRTEAPKH
jgi:hypothetical protein